MQKPLIGVTAGEVFNRDRPWAPVTYGQSHTYVDAVIKAGGIPIIFPMTKDLGVLKEVCSKIDGLLMCGGNDLNPQLYGESPYASLDEPSALRDNNERYILTEVLKAERPILAICRGLQFINVYNGGNLYQDIKTDLPHAMNHEISTEAQDLTHRAHSIKIDKKSKLYKILGTTEVETNSHHHQAIKKLGDGLRASAHTIDDVIEAIETDDNRFIIGIQAHPESLVDAIPTWDKLFRAFVVAART